MTGNGRVAAVALTLCLALMVEGCKRFEVTAVPLSRWNCDEPPGIPFYLPKPLLIVTKNVRYVETEKVGLTDGVPIPNQFDDQAKYADLNARTDFRGLPAGNTQRVEAAGSTPSVAGAAGTATASGQHLLAPDSPYISPDKAPTDGLVPNTFYTVRIVFIPDLSQKYGLRVRGGPGEVRAALNLVNGWMFTGLGPFYVKDSSTAQNVLAAGIGANLAAGGVSEVVRSLADLRQAAAARGLEAADVARILESIEERLGAPTRQPAFDIQPGTLEDFAEIYVFEPVVDETGAVMWQEVCALKFDREYLGYYRPASSTAKAVSLLPPRGVEQPVAGAESRTEAAPLPSARGVLSDRELRLVAGLLGVPADRLMRAAPEAEPGASAGQPVPSPSEGTDKKVRLLRRLPVLRHLVPKRSIERVVIADGGGASGAVSPEPQRTGDDTDAVFLPDNPGPLP